VLRVAIVGKQGSGKSTIAEALCACAREPYVVKFADPIYNTLESLNKPKNRKFMQGFGDLVKECFGKLYFVDHLDYVVKSVKKNIIVDLIVCDDCRYRYEYKKLKELGFTVIGVYVDDAIRKKRVEDSGYEFIENHNSEQDVDSILEQLDIVVDNNNADISRVVKWAEKFYTTIS
jgi:dephospho-CoA kinase